MFELYSVTEAADEFDVPVDDVVIVAQTLELEPDDYDSETGLLTERGMTALREHFGGGTDPIK